MTGAAITFAIMALVPAPAVDQLVVTTAPPLDAQRLADALRAYLDEFGIRIGTRAPSEADDLRRRLEEGRALGEAVRAFAVVRVERGSPETVEIELIDLATQKALIATVPRPARDEDLYRALALKIQSILRATLSEARAELDPRSSLGRLALETTGAPPARARAHPFRPRRRLRDRRVPDRRRRPVRRPDRAGVVARVALAGAHARVGSARLGTRLARRR